MQSKDIMPNLNGAHIALCCHARVVYGDCDAPGWCRYVVTQEWLLLLVDLQKLCYQRDLTEVRQSSVPEWEGGDVDKYSLSEIVVSAGGVFWQVLCSDEDLVESKAIDIQHDLFPALRLALAKGEDTILFGLQPTCQEMVG